MPDSELRWKEKCRVCGKTHIYCIEVCPNCGVHETAQPIREKVKLECGGEICEGCEAYQEHLYI